MIRKKKSKTRRLNYLIILAAIIAVAWDISVANMDIEPGTFRYESEFDALTGATTKVSIVTSDYEELSSPVDRTVNPSYMQIEEMVGKAIELQGGLDWVIDKGDKVYIKVNLVGKESPSGQGENTDVRVVKALVRHIHAHTEGDVEIQIAEGTARDNDDPTLPGSVWENSGYTDLLTDTMMTGINFSLLNINQSLEDMMEVDLGSEGTSAPQGTKYTVHRAQLVADKYIAVPVLKIHNTGITSALKLQIGSAPGCYYGYNKTVGTTLCPSGIHHDIDHRAWNTEAIVDLSNIADIDFVLVDAIMCLETRKTYIGTNQVRFNTILAGADPVALDHVGAKMMGLNPDDVAHITLAEKVGLGTNDPAHIDLVGVPLEQAMKKVKKSQSKEGKYGQSNRTWILSQAFGGFDNDQEFFADEAFIEPIPGEDGWSLPVYFFDDRIDLLSYYAGQSEIVSYAFTYFKARQSQEAELWLGTEEAIKVYLNGEQVYDFSLFSPYGDEDRGSKKGVINIKEGRNTLLVKSMNNFGDYSFALNICEVESDPLYFGNRVAGLKFYMDESGTGTELTGISDAEIKQGAALRSYPNPATRIVNISFELLESAQTSIEIIDVSGRVIKSFGNEERGAGFHELKWNLESNQGGRVRSGTYLCVLNAGDDRQTTKLIVR